MNESYFVKNDALNSVKNDAAGAIMFYVEEEKDKTKCLLKLASDGFYVRGEKLLQDENEAKKVYEAFCQWLAKVHMLNS